MRVFITGGAGFIGSHLVDRLVSDGHDVTVYDNLSNGKKQFIASHISSGKVKFIKADLLDIKKLKISIKGHDIVFHLAANPDIRYGIKFTDTDLNQNTVATYNVLESMRVNGIKKIAFASTSTIYGESKVMPTPEEYGPLMPISLYGASKLACEALCTAFSHTFDMKCFIFRFANIVGGRGTHGIIFDFINKFKKDPNELEILGNGKQIKSYLLVDDCVDAMLFVVEHAKEQYNIYNLGSDDRMDIMTIAETVRDKMNLRSAKFRLTGGERGWPGDVSQMSLAVKKLNALGWKAKNTSKQAVEIAVDRMVREGQ
jgi:UDP-glucose 4-epimerase